MKTIKNVLISFSMVFMLSCMDTIELDVKSYEPMVVVDGEINNMDDMQSLRLSITQPYFQSGQKEIIEEAVVNLYENDHLIGTYAYNKEGEYSLEYRGKIGNEYNVEITLPHLAEHTHLSGKVIKSKAEKLESVSEITALRYEFKEESLVFEEGYYLLIDTYDPKGKGNNYRWKVAVNGVVSNDPRHILVMEDDRVDGNLITGLDLTYDPFQEGDEIVVYQQSISNKFYQYLFDIYMQALTQESFFDSPAYNPKSNLISDIPVVGYFNASAYHSASIIMGE
ncbi:DUF4249 domain-containing protein [Pararhodonellum marinum]|uniref:DUF4249 domain-containing protein n=1 Tax=Pararhodonellum marinum TaxID=2755358 RepID=UPI00188EC44F|nr:DUF4249 domain-containing protein [Pararhodonellum marinum]